jgi:hypothetical protein
VIAAGATTGIDHFNTIVTQILPALKVAEAETMVFLDFSGIEDATPSYIKATVLALHQCGRRYLQEITLKEHAEVGELSRPLNIIVGVLNASQQVQDCINEVFASRGFAVLGGAQVTDERFDEAVVLGVLDSKIYETLQRACGLEEFQASDLLEKNKPTGSILVTGWNNRLAELHRQRLLLRRTEGRTNRFRSFANKVTSHHGHLLLRQ